MMARSKGLKSFDSVIHTGSPVRENVSPASAQPLWLPAPLLLQAVPTKREKQNAIPSSGLCPQAAAHAVSAPAILCPPFWPLHPAPPGSFHRVIPSSLDVVCSPHHPPFSSKSYRVLYYHLHVPYTKYFKNLSLIFLVNCKEPWERTMSLLSGPLAITGPGVANQCHFKC